MKCIPYAEGPNHAAALELGEYRHSREMNIFTITHYYPLLRAQSYLEGILLTRDYQPGFERKNGSCVAQKRIRSIVKLTKP
jgi:hypothetical protein